MKFSILTSDRNHPVVPKLEQFLRQMREHEGELVFSKRDLRGGDILFIVSCHEMVGPKTRIKYRHSLVLHGSPLPKGRGWSPHIWRILEGAEEITCTLLEASEPVDSGPIWLQKTAALGGHELYDEINQIFFNLELDLMTQVLSAPDQIQVKPQSDEPPTWYHRRTPADNELDPNMSILSQLNLLRVSDPQRFPAYFYHLGHRYTIQITKSNPEPTK